MMDRRWKIIFLCIMFAGLLVSLPAGVLAGANDEIRIAVGGPHTGFAAEFGAEEFRGAELALQELGGKIAGRPVKLMKTDTKCDASEAVKKFRDSLLRDKVHAFIGPVCGSSGLSIVGVGEGLSGPAYFDCLFGAGRCHYAQKAV